MSEIIPISKTPTQEKVPFIPPQLDWNENGKCEWNFGESKLSNLSTFNSSSFFSVQAGDHVNFPTPSRICPTSRSARAIAWERSATGPDHHRPTKSTTTTSISLSLDPAANMLTITMRTRLPSTWSTMHAFKSRLISADASVETTATIGELMEMTKVMTCNLNWFR